MSLVLKDILRIFLCNNEIVSLRIIIEENESERRVLLTTRKIIALPFSSVFFKQSKRIVCKIIGAEKWTALKSNNLWIRASEPWVFVDVSLKNREFVVHVLLSHTAGSKVVVMMKQLNHIQFVFWIPSSANKRGLVKYPVIPLRTSELHNKIIQ